LVLARKYRPKNFKELIGQEAITQVLTLALDKKQLSFAYLFSGLRGSGKTSTARIFAKALICQKGVSSTPCEECANCKMANNSSHIDIIELDAASNRRIDDIRELIEHTKYKPATARYKVFIIDEVHMLTKEAFNALLKTLEEPPEYVKFILATTDPLKLPATILSRTQHFRFRKISNKTLKNHLKNILKEENIEFEDGAIDIIVRFSKGSVRDSLTLLDQAIIYSKGFIDTKSVTEMLGTLNPSIIEELIDNILNGDINYIREFIEKSTEFETETIIDEIILYLKDMLLNNSNSINYYKFDSFFKILADAKELLSIGSDGEFVLAITLFKMLDIKKIENKPKSNIKKIEKIEPPKESEEDRKFKALIEKIYRFDKRLGEVFEKNIKFISFENGILTWESSAIKEERELLKHRFGQIRMYVSEVYRTNKIKNVSKVLTNIDPPKPKLEPKKEKIIDKKKEKEPLSNRARLEILRKEEPVLDMAINLFKPKKVVLDYKDIQSETC